jgi:hypothetical protein
LAKSTIQDDYMRAAGLWSPGQVHANDAMRHAILFLRRASKHPQFVEAYQRPLGLDLMDGSAP